MKLNTDPADAIGNMRVIDAIYEKAGLKTGELNKRYRVSSTTNVSIAKSRVIWLVFTPSSMKSNL